MMHCYLLKIPSRSFFLVFLGVFSVPFFASAQLTELATPSTDPDPIQQSLDLLDTYRARIPTPSAIRSASIQGSVVGKVSPEMPGQNELVTVTLTSTLTNLDSASISWTIDGKLAQSGKGKKVFSFTTGAYGTRTTVTASVTTTEGVFTIKTWSFRPMLVDLAWEADTYTPPFYRGKALPSTRAGLRVVATIQGSSVNPSSLIYRWKKDQKVLSDISGYGKSSAFIPQAFERGGATSIEVEVTSVDGTFTAKKGILVSAVEPQARLYEERPLEGIIYQRSLGATADAHSNEFTVRVEPYFVPLADWNAKKVLYQWNLNGRTLPDKNVVGAEVFGEYGPNRMTLVNASQKTKTVSLEFGMQNIATMSHIGRNMLTVILGAKDTAGGGF